MLFPLITRLLLSSSPTLPLLVRLQNAELVYVSYMKISGRLLGDPPFDHCRVLSSNLKDVTELAHKHRVPVMLNSL
ncbi:hypothetical protein L218DRAFT_659280 [Marasmius fiardii PR-910]|nr:hypothetical protein L218DRAFT_659280 [Marasmius fiardii PR-910]